ncbi:MAG: zf-HC2 domain-containing protein, partial [Gemmatimonadaceae bacterium]
MSVSIAAGSMSTDRGDSHLDAHDIAAYVDHTATPDQRDRVERHLAECIVCRDEMLEVSALASPARAVSRPAWRIAAGIAAAAVILVVAWPARHVRQPDTVHREE